MVDQQTPRPLPPASFRSPTSPTPSDPHTTNSPHHSHFYSFHRRFRRPSSSVPADPAIDKLPKSSPSPAIAPKPPSKHDETYKEAARVARRILKDHIRTDWEFDPSSSSLPFAQPCFRSDQLDAMGPGQDGRGAIEYVRRQSGSSSPSSDEEGYHDARDPMWADGEANDQRSFKFESPEDVGNTIRARRKAKRKKEKEEMEWNIGLRTWTARRNAWTDATKTKPPKSSRRPIRNFHDTTENSSAESRSTDTQSEQAETRPLSPPDSHSDLEPDELSLDSDGSSDGGGPYLPIHPPLIPNSNVVRAAIGPKLYPMIYSKVIVQSLSPSVPIPLPHLVKALVQGWREEGNWPPKVSNDGIADGRAVGKGTASGVVAQAKREAMKIARLGRDKDHESQHYHRKVSSIGGMGGAVRKAFGLKGHKPHNESGTSRAGSVVGHEEHEESMEWDGDFLDQ